MRAKPGYTYLSPSWSSFNGLHCRSVWLAENQSRPLPVFQVEREGGERVLTCCLLPQRKYIQPPEEKWAGTLTRVLNLKFDEHSGSEGEHCSSISSVITITENSAVKTELRPSVKSHGIWIYFKYNLENEIRNTSNQILHSTFVLIYRKNQFNFTTITNCEFPVLFGYLVYLQPSVNDRIQIYR